MHWPGRPPSVDTLMGTPRIWVRLGREDAVRFCRTLPVAVVYENLGQWVSTWLSQESPFYLASGPYDYVNLKYFLFGGSLGTGAGTGGSGARPRKETKTPETEGEAASPAEDSEFLEEPAETEAPSASQAKLTAKPSRPGPPNHPTIPLAIQGPEVPQAPKIPEVSGPIEVIDLPEADIPDVAVTEADAAGTALPDLALPARPAERKPSPVEIRLVSPKGLPLAETGFTLTFPDGSRLEGKSDARGFIKAPDNDQPGRVKLVLAGFGG